MHPTCIRELGAAESQSRGSGSSSGSVRAGRLRRRWMAGLAVSTLLLFIHASARAEWQWSVPMGNGRAFLWVPPQCERLRGVVVAQNNMIEMGILEHADFRRALAREGIGEVFIAPPFEFIFRFDQDAGLRFNDVMTRLADVSGYTELNVVPVVPMGHSACASYPWNFAAWNPGRTLAVLSLKGDAPLTRFTGCGQPNPDWGDRTLDGVPGLMVMAEYEWGDSQHGVDRLSPALEYRRRHPKAPIAMLAEPGEGHFNYSDELVRYLAMFVRKAARERLPDRAAQPSNCAPLKPVDPAKGWLVERWYLNQPRTVEPAPFAQYKGDPAQAFWAFDKEMALATHRYNAEQPGKRPQLLSVSDGVMPIEKTCGEPVVLRFLPEDDGVTFHLRTAFMAEVPPNANAERWAYSAAGSKLGHATRGGPIRLRKIAGPVIQTGPNTFQLALDRINSTNDRRSSSIWFWAVHPGDSKYKSIVQQAVIHVPPNTDGTVQSISFPAISDVREGTKSLNLEAVSDAGLKVRYYVLEGPAEVDGATLKFTHIPPRAMFPVRVTVVAWQHGLPGKIAAAEPVARQFSITK